MTSRIISLACLGSFSVQRIWAQVGGHDKPSPSAWTSPVVPLGQHVTLQCHSHLGFDRFRLCKDAGGHVPNLQDVRFQNSLLVGPVTSARAGTYRCLGYYSRSPSARSVLSDPLTIVVTGVYRKPSLIAQPGPLVQSGRNGTLQCRSEITFDSFILILHREGGTTDPLHFVRQLHDGGSQANFPVGTMTSVCAGTYRCLCSLSHSHYEWSAPSDPLDMAITGLCRKPPLPGQVGPTVRSSGNLTPFSHSKSSLDVYHLFREGESHGCWLAAGHSHNGTCQAEFPLGPGSPAHSATYSCHGLSSHSPYRWSDPSDPLYLSVTGDSSTSRTKPSSNTGNLHVVVGPSAAILFLAILPFFLIRHWCSAKKNAATVNSKPEVPRMVNRADPETEEPREVAYALWDHWTSTQKKVAPTSQRPTEPSTGTSVYADLAAH